MHAEIRRKRTGCLEFWGEYPLCMLTTLRPDGRPHVVPVGVTLNADAGIARMATRKSSRKVSNVQAALPGRRASPYAEWPEDAGRLWRARPKPKAASAAA
ncbi:pyridoxamine 5'-phosphate oxidase family protein [Streptomyces sp. NPDC055722]